MVPSQSGSRSGEQKLEQLRCLTCAWECRHTPKSDFAWFVVDVHEKRTTTSKAIRGISVVPTAEQTATRETIHKHHQKKKHKQCIGKRASDTSQNHLSGMGMRATSHGEVKRDQTSRTVTFGVDSGACATAAEKDEATRENKLWSIATQSECTTAGKNESDGAQFCISQRIRNETVRASR